MGFIREQFGRITIESRRESFMIHVEDASLREPSSEWWTSDLDDLIAALTDYRASLGPASGGGNGVDTPPPNPYAGHECDQHRGRPAASPADERLREALERANDDLILIADESPEGVGESIDSVRAAIKDALAAADREKPEE